MFSSKLAACSPTATVMIGDVQTPGIFCFSIIVEIPFSRILRTAIFLSALMKVSNLGGMEYYQVDTLGESLISMALSPSGEAIAFGDEGGRVHIWGSKDNPRINSFPKPIHWPKTPLLHRPPALLDDFDSLAALPFTGLIALKFTIVDCCTECLFYRFYGRSPPDCFLL